MPSRLGRHVAIAAAVLLAFATAGGVTQMALNRGDADAPAPTTNVEIASAGGVETPMVQAGSVSTPGVITATTDTTLAPEGAPADTAAAPPATGGASKPSGTSASAPASSNAGSNSTPASNPSTNAPAETPVTNAPVAAPVYASSTDDNSFSYSGNWGVCSNCDGAYGGKGDYHYSDTMGGSATFAFNGRQGKMLIIFGEGGARVSIKVDGREVTQWDTANSSRQGRWFDTGVLGDANANHSITVTIVGKGSTNGNTVAVDRGETWR